MTCMERTVAATTMDLPSVRNSTNYANHESTQVASSSLYTEHFYISSEDLYNQIEKDYEAYLKSLPNAWETHDVLSFSESDAEDVSSLYIKGRGFDQVDMEKCQNEHKSELWHVYSDPTYPLPDAFSIMVNPATGALVTNPFIHINSSETPFTEEPVELQNLRKPYHPCQDHDYLPKNEGRNDNMDNVDNVEVFSEDEPNVDVWEIENFLEKQGSSSPDPEELPICRPTCKKETRRSSARTAEIRRREQARKISNAVHAAVLKTGKVRNTRQFKNIKPKNSVETTPSQSDIEEFYCQPVKQTYTRTTKKKTCKGRIDHSESERHRREVLRRNFSALCDLIPNEYLRGDKVSSQISKQKILNGAKSYLIAVHSAKSSYKILHHENKLLRERWQKIQAKLQKCIKRQN